MTDEQILRISYWPVCSRAEDSGNGGNGGGSACCMHIKSLFSFLVLISPSIHTCPRICTRNSLPTARYFICRCTKGLLHAHQITTHAHQITTHAHTEGLLHTH